ncbi:MAG: flagellar hook-length control protein FliK [Phycisphaerales bacterium]|jgi:hypothetical protein|nr:flagellar hook-length control protein FliK [Phycisphaerales bacterium]
MPEAESIAASLGPAVRAQGSAEAAPREAEVARRSDQGVSASEEASREFVRALLGQVGLHANATTHVNAGVAMQRETLLSSEFVRTGAAGSGPSELLRASADEGDEAPSLGEGREVKNPGRGARDASHATGSRAGQGHDGSGAPAEHAPRADEGPGAGGKGGERGEGNPRAAQATNAPARGENASGQATGAAAPVGSNASSVPASGARGAGGSPGVQGVSGPGVGSAGAARGAVPQVNALGLRGVRAETKPKGAAPAPRGAKSEQVQLQLSRGLAAALRSAGKEVTLRLTPEALGEVRVRVRFENGGVIARFEASDAKARSLLEQSVGSLRSAMESRGLGVERIEIGPGPEAGGAGDRGASDAGVSGHAWDGASAGDGHSGEQRDAGHSRGGAGAEGSWDEGGRGSVLDGDDALDARGDGGVVREGMVVLGVDALA